MDDLLSEFLTETNESLGTLDVELVKLEQNPNDPELLSNIFRLMHTIKGTCGFLGLPRLESVAHAGENILGKFRDGELEVTPDAVTLILESIDAIKSLVAAIGKTGTEPEGNDATLIDKLSPRIKNELQGINPSSRDLSQIKAQVILLHGRGDTMIPYTESIAIAQALPKEQVTLFLIEGYAHTNVKPKRQDLPQLLGAMDLLIQQRVVIDNK